MATRTILPIILAIIIAVVVFATQGFLSFVKLISSYLRGDQLVLVLPKRDTLVSGPIIAGIIVSKLYTSY